MNFGLGPQLVRLAFHDSIQPGGMRGMWRVGSAAGNTDANFVDSLLTGVPAGAISFSDALAYSAAVSLSAANTHNAAVKFRPGRRDAMQAGNITLPIATWDSASLRTFWTNLGFTSDQDVVALMGAHSFGNCHPQVSGYSGPWTSTPLTLTNEFFRLLSPNKNGVSTFNNVTITFNGTSNWQWEDDTGKVMLPVDMSLAQDSQYQQWVNLYASDEPTFVNDFVRVYAKLLELNLSPDNLGPFVDASLAPPPAPATPPNTACYPNNTLSNPVICATITNTKMASRNSLCTL
ncbi:heme peroxidase [Podochytrium sp. JEL0797]|nr:heme peroxidase [Podochytrium sp. JEL0797]